jgi:hypothetical protein
MDKGERKVCLDLSRDLVLTTPVKSGLARNNYFFGLDRNGSSTTDVSKNGKDSNIRSLEWAGKLKSGGTWFITNNLPYILQIMEYGTSTQAAPGAVSRIVARWQAIVDNAFSTTSKSNVDYGKGLS